MSLEAREQTVLRRLTGKCSPETGMLENLNLLKGNLSLLWGALNVVSKQEFVDS